MRKIVIIRYDKNFEWENQAKQYPANGSGIVYYKGVWGSKWVDCLLFYGDDEILEGILNYYPFDLPPYEKKGNVNIQVRLDKRRKGIATALLNEGILRFKINLKNQIYTPLGKKFINNYMQSLRLKNEM